MALAKILNSLEGLEESLHEHYKKRGDKYVLDITGDDDTTALRNAKDREKKRADDEAQARRDLEKEYTTLQRKLSDLEANPETETLRKQVEESDAKFSKLTERLKDTAKRNEAERIASEISKAPKLLSRFVADRLTVDLDEDFNTVVKPTTADGKTADDFTVDALKKEFAANKDFSDIIVASKASGGGAPRGGTEESRNSGRGAFNQTQQKDAPLLSELPTSDLVAAMKAKKEASGA